MISDAIAYIDYNGQQVPRIQRRRNRKDIISVNDVTMDANGHISHRPVASLACFANPIEYYRGSRDKPYKWKGETQPNWCAGCRSFPACSTFASRRVEENSSINAKLLAWEIAAQYLPGNERYEHVTFTDFATACNERGWTSSNDDALMEKRFQDRTRKRLQRAAARRKNRRTISITLSNLAISNDERDHRFSALLTAARAPKAPTWLRNLSDTMISLTCDVWQVRDTIERRHKGEVTGGDIARALINLNRTHGIIKQSLRIRVNEAIRRIERLYHEPTQAPVWAAFDSDQTPVSLRSPGQFLNGMAVVVLDDLDDL